jgi:hypothetical protein
MPRGDRSGPSGMGPRTGRALGYCAGLTEPGFATAGPAGRFGFRRPRFCAGPPGWGGGAWSYGAGWGRGYRYWATGQPAWMPSAPPTGWAPHPITPEAAADAEGRWLKQQAEWLSGQLEAVQQRLRQLDEEAPPEP